MPDDLFKKFKKLGKVKFGTAKVNYFYNLHLMFFSRLRGDGEEEEVGEVDDRGVPTVQGNVHQGNFLGNRNSIFKFIPLIEK